MVKGHDQRLVHCRVALDQRLDRQREDVLAAAHEHIVVAPNEVIETFFIPPANVAGIVPTIAQAVGCLGRQVVIAEQHAGILHYEFTFIWIRTPNQAGFGSRIRHADGLRRTRIAFGMWAERHRSPFGDAVHNERFGIREIFLELSEELRR